MRGLHLEDTQGWLHLNSLSDGLRRARMWTSKWRKTDLFKDKLKMGVEIIFRCEWRQPTACIALKNSLERWSQRATLHVLESLSCNGTKPASTQEERRPFDAVMDMVAWSGWDCCHRWMMVGHDPVRRSCSTAQEWLEAFNKRPLC